MCAFQTWIATLLTSADNQSVVFDNYYNVHSDKNSIDLQNKFPTLNTYYNDNGEDIEIKTPLIANLLPMLGFSIGVSYGLVTKKKPYISLAIGLGVGAVFSIPKLIMINKALDSVRADRAKVASDANATNAEAGVQEVSAREPATADMLIDLLEEICAHNNTNQNFLPKKEYFRGVFEEFTQDERDATYDLLSIIHHTPMNPTEEESLLMMEKISQLEENYGKEFIDNINSRLNEVDEAVNKVTEEKETVAV